MAYQSQQGWQQQMAARSAMQMSAAQQQMAGGMPGSTSQQGYEQTLRAQAAYAAHYAYMAEQQRGQGGMQASAYAGAPAQQGAYPGAQQQGGAFGYGAAAAYPGAA